MQPTEKRMSKQTLMRARSNPAWQAAMVLLLTIITACGTPNQPLAAIDGDNAPLLEYVTDTLPHINFDLLRPAAAPANLLVSPDDLSVKPWTKGPGVGVQANAEPRLSRLTRTGTGSGYINQRSSATAGGRYSARVFLKGSGSVSLFLQRAGGNYGVYIRQTVVLTEGGTLVTIDVSRPEDGFAIQFGLGDLNSNELILVGQAELVAGSFEGEPPPPTPSVGNLLAESSNISASVWSKGNVVVASNVDGEFDQLTAKSGNGGYVNQRTNAKAAGTYTGRATLKGNGTSEIFLQRGGGDYAQYIRQRLMLTNQAIQVSVTAQKPADTYQLQFGIGNIDGGESVLVSQTELVVGAGSSGITAINLSASPSSVSINQAALVQVNISGTGAFSSAVTMTVQPTTASITLLASGYEFKSAIPGTYTVTATSSADPSKTGSTSITVANDTAPSITGMGLQATPNPVTVNQSSSLNLSFTGTGSFSQAVTWTVTPSGTVTGAEPYSFTSSTTGTFTLKATSVFDPSKSASLNLVVNAAIPTGNGSSGAWSNTISLPTPPIHAALMPNGKVLFWGYDENTTSDSSKNTPTYLWDTNAGNSTLRIDQPVSKIFCSAHSFLPDGRLLTIGGITRNSPAGVPQLGIKDTSIFDLSTQSWRKSADMILARYYPSSVLLGNGEVLALAGTNGTNGANVDTPEVWQTNSGLSETSPSKYRLLSSARFSQGHYPIAFQAPNGKVFNLGPQRTMGWLDPNGAGGWQSLGNRNDPEANSRTYGNGIMYAPGKILLTGGADPPTATALTVDVTGSSPVVTQVASMQRARRQQNSTLLADGTVLVTGGSSGAGFNNAAQAVLGTELWNPSNGQFKSLANARTPRLYHSIALLLPDARVLAAGGASGDAPQYPNAEIFTPPYLLNADGTAALRPVISSAPDLIAYGSSFNLTASGTVARVALVKLGSVTHSTNFDQRFIELGFNTQGTGLNVTAPANGNIAPPGHYLLFVLNAAGVPSVAKIIKLN